MNRSKVIIISIVGLLVIGVIFLFATVGESDSDSDGFENSPGSQTESEFSFEDMMETEEGNLFDAEDEKLDPTRSRKNSVERMLEKDDTLYGEEQDPRFLKMQRQIELMQQMQEGQQTTEGAVNAQPAPKPLTLAEKEALKRAELLRAREERLARSQDYSAPTKVVPVDNSAADLLEFRASVYRDQFILPGDRVTLILNEPITYKGNVFEKNTFIYCTANIQGSRVLLNTTNIDHVPVQLIAKDVADGDIGMYSKRAGELWREFSAEAQSSGVNDVASEIANQARIPLAGSAIRAFGQFFRNKKYRDKDKILLVNNDELILTTPTN